MGDQNEQERRSFPRHTPLPRPNAAWRGAGVGRFGKHAGDTPRHQRRWSRLGRRTGLPQVGSVFVKLADSDEAGWTSANVAGLEEIADWGTLSASTFEEECPFDLFRAVVGSAAELAASADNRNRAILALPIGFVICCEPFPSRYCTDWSFGISESLFRLRSQITRRWSECRVARATAACAEAAAYPNLIDPGV